MNWSTPSLMRKFRSSLCSKVGQPQARDGCHEPSVLWQELQHKGYRGQRKSVAEYLQRFRKQTSVHSSRQLSWLFMKDADGLQEEEINHLQAMFVENPKLQEIYQLAQSFRKMLSRKAPELLDDWLLQMEACGVKRLQNFAAGLRQDYEAVKAA